MIATISNGNTPHEWQSLQALFERLLATPAEQRRALAQRVEPDDGLRQSALALIAAHESPSDPLDAWVLGALRRIASRRATGS